MTIPRPDRPRKNKERFDACQIAIEEELIDLVERACDAGWHRDEVLSAVSDVADNLALARREDVAMAIELWISQMKKKHV